jgi:inosine/xanthosine triphosphatase
MSEDGRFVVGVGSLRGPKLEAVRDALQRLAPLDGRLSSAEIAARDVASVAPAMPLSIDELVQGARVRAHTVLERLAAEGTPASLGVGLEGGLEVRGTGRDRRAYLMSWAYVTDGRRGAHGCGGGLELPPAIVDEVVDQGVELAHAIDRFVGETDVRSRQGAWGVLTRGAVSRSASFEMALLNAFAPFYNPDSYP